MGRIFDEEKMGCPDLPTMLRAMQSGLILDTETTGLTEGDTVLSVALLDSVTLNTVFYAAFQPLCKVNPEAFRTHRLTTEFLATCLPFDAATPALTYFLTLRPIIAFNASFDRRLIAQTYKAVGLMDPPKGQWLCAQQFMQWVLGRRRLSLKTAAETFGIPYEGAHHAVQDCRITARCLRKAMQRAAAGIPPIPDESQPWNNIEESTDV